MGRLMRVCFAFEEADWDQLDYIALQFELSGERMHMLYYEALHWAQNMNSTIN